MHKRKLSRPSLQQVLLSECSMSEECCAEGGLVWGHILMGILCASKKIQLHSWECTASSSVLHENVVSGDSFVRGVKYLLVLPDARYCNRLEARCASQGHMQIPSQLRHFAQQLAKIMMYECGCRSPVTWS
jgi:hypothetical protein